MRLKVITLNLFQGGLYFKNIKDFLKKENPDVLCLQEANDNKDKKLAENFRSIETLKEILPNYYYHFAPELLEIREEGKIPVGNAIFSRFPITKTNAIFYDIPYGEYEAYLENDIKYDFSIKPKNLEYTQIKLNGIKLNFFNTHGIWGHNGKDTRRRLRMGQIIINNIKDKNNVVLAGDFNLSPITQTIMNIEKHLKNVFTDDLATTFNIRLKPHHGDYAASVVDMVFVSKDIRILKKYCPDVDVSDHFPLVCVLEIAGTTALS